MTDEIEQPIIRFISSPAWVEAGWSATTFRWHPQSEAPPVMGIVFDNAEVGRGIFRDFCKYYNHTDRFEELRISIIEGSLPRQRPGYSVHLCPDPESLQAHATAEDIVLSGDPKLTWRVDRWNRMYPVPGSPPLLPRFKEEYNKHKEFLLAPVTRRADGQNYVDVDCWIIKNCITFRSLSEITPDDIDAMALAVPTLITPR